MRRRRQVYVYFFSAPGRIKIGISKDVANRLITVASHMENKPVLLGVIEGDRHFEKHLHKLLAQHRRNGEWFNDCAEVREVMEKVLGGDKLGFEPPPPLALTVRPQREQTPEQWLTMFNALVSMVWPGDPVAGLADFLEMPRDTVSAYLTGKEEIPKIVAYAFSAHLFGWMMNPNSDQERFAS